MTTDSITSSEGEVGEQTTFRALLELGRAGEFDRIRALPEAGSHSGVASVVSRWRAARAFIAELPNQDLAHFARAIAVFEHTADGFGSVTLLQHIVPALDESSRQEVLEWIVGNTCAFWYYQQRYGFAPDTLRRFDHL